MDAVQAPGVLPTRCTCEDYLWSSAVSRLEQRPGALNKNVNSEVGWAAVELENLQNDSLARGLWVADGRVGDIVKPPSESSVHQSSSVALPAFSP